IGERQKVLVTEESFDAQYFVAHNKFYEQVLVPKQPEFTGKMIEVDVYESGKHFLKGRPVDHSKPLTASIAAPLLKGQVSGLTQETPNGQCHGAIPTGCFSVDRERLKTIGLGLAVAAAMLALLLEKLYY
ncbi:unnamed protein product, partial [Gadus morhua 'NCC']